jgi:hypothetical protein
MSARIFWTICYLGVAAGLGIYIATLYYPMPDYAPAASMGSVLLCYLICAIINARLKQRLTNQYDTPLMIVYYKYILYLTAIILTFKPVKALVHEASTTGVAAIFRIERLQDPQWIYPITLVILASLIRVYKIHYEPVDTRKRIEPTLGKKRLS